MSAQQSIAGPQRYTPGSAAFVPPVRRTLTLARSICRAKDLFRIAFGVIWVIDAAFKWQPAFRTGFADTLKGAAQGQPGWLHGWFQFWINLVTPNASFFAYSTVVIETMVAVALIVGFARKLTYIGAALFSVMIWATAEGFGGPYTAGSTDIGAAVIYAVVFMGLLALNYEGGPSRFSVDYLIEQRVSWWHRLAEVGHKGQTGELLHRPAVTTTAPPVMSAPLETEPAQRDAIGPEVAATARQRVGHIAIGALILIAATRWHYRDRA